MDLSVSSTEQGAVTVVHVAGEIDVYTAPLLREVLDKQVAAGRTELVVDLEKVTFMDSTGLGVLVGRLRRAHGAGAIVGERVERRLRVAPLRCRAAGLVPGGPVLLERDVARPLRRVARHPRSLLPVAHSPSGSNFRS